VSAVAEEGAPASPAINPIMAATCRDGTWKPAKGRQTSPNVMVVAL
jgi:hypothetical protein